MGGEGIDSRLRKWALEPKSQQAVDLMLSHPPMTQELAIARANGFIDGDKWVPPHKRKRGD